LPVVSEVTATKKPDGEDRGAAKSSLRILIVDDNKDLANILSLLLENMGNEIRIAYDGQDGVDLALEYKPDVVLLDIGLPTLNGYEACRLIREQSWGKSVVLIASTGWGQSEDRRRSQEAGFDHHMVKPIDLKDLEKILVELQATKMALQDA
jgi:CheY-like chemotaxis protein